jgi:hypothetical protein
MSASVTRLGRSPAPYQREPCSSLKTGAAQIARSNETLSELRSQSHMSKPLPVHAISGKDQARVDVDPLQNLQARRLTASACARTKLTARA